MKIYNVRIGLPMPNQELIKSFTKHKEALEFYNTYHPDYPKQLNQANTFTNKGKEVAPRAGAWIETFCLMSVLQKGA